jgi:predicted transcriptional regulator
MSAITSPTESYQRLENILPMLPLAAWCLEPRDLGCYCHLIRAGGTAESIKKLSEICGVDLRTAENFARRLVEKGLAKKTHKKSRNGYTAKLEVII